MTAEVRYTQGTPNVHRSTHAYMMMIVEVLVFPYAEWFYMRFAYSVCCTLYGCMIRWNTTDRVLLRAVRCCDWTHNIALAFSCVMQSATCHVHSPCAQVGNCIPPRMKKSVIFKLTGRNFPYVISKLYIISEYVVSDKCCVELPWQNVRAQKNGCYK